MRTSGYDLSDTIVAIASAPGGSVEGVLRCSGPETVPLVARLFRAEPAVPWTASRTPVLCQGVLTALGRERPLPARLYLWPTARSYTRQPLAELHTWGSPPLLAEVQRAAIAAGGRLAGPGEFTLRAVLAGRIDLQQAVAVLGVINATGEVQLRQSLTRLAGGLAAPLGRLRESLLELLAQVEAELDFADEDLDFLPTEVLKFQLAAAQAQVQGLLEQTSGRATFGPTVRVALCGPANAGKSSLFNRLCDEPRALVSPQAGTTRDPVQAVIRWGGVDVELVDTAGLIPHPENTLSQAGQALSQAEFAEANLVLWCQANDEVPEPRAGFPPQGWAGSVLQVVTKVDQPAAWQPPPGAICTSSRSGQGIPALIQAIQLHGQADAGSREVAGGAGSQCHAALAGARAAVALALVAAEGGGRGELVAYHLRDALVALGEVAGVTSSDDVLTRVFSQFCIGK